MTTNLFDYDFAGALQGLLGQAYVGDLKRSQFVTMLKAAIDQAAGRAWQKAIHQPHYTGSRAMPQVLTAAVKAQKGFVDNFSKAIFEAAALPAEQSESKKRQIAVRALMWAASIAHFAELAESFVSPFVLVRWRVGPTEHCATCKWLDGQIHTRKWFMERGYWPHRPGTTALECGGWMCQCFFESLGAPVVATKSLLREAFTEALGLALKAKFVQQSEGKGEKAFEEAKHPRKGKGDPNGGEFAPKPEAMNELADALAANRAQRSGTYGERLDNPDAEAMLAHPETRRRIDNIMGAEETDKQIKKYIANPANYKPDTYYRTEGLGAGAGVGKGMYLGQDERAINNFYNLDGDLEVAEYHGHPKWLNLMDYQTYADFEDSAKKKYGAGADHMREAALAKGYDGIRYYDPEATGEEFVLYDTDGMKKARVVRKAKAGAFDTRDLSAPKPAKIVKPKPPKTAEEKKWAHENAEFEKSLIAKGWHYDDTGALVPPVGKSAGDFITEGKRHKAVGWMADALRSALKSLDAKGHVHQPAGSRGGGQFAPKSGDAGSGDKGTPQGERFVAAHAVGDYHVFSTIEGAVDDPLPDIVDWLAARHKEQDASLSASQREAVSDYGAGGYHINDQLRGKDKTALNPSESIFVTTLDSAMRPLPESIVTYRGLEGMPFGDTIKVGQVFRDNGYGSTTLRMGKARLIAGPKGALVHIRLPKGTPVCYPHTIEHEREVMVHRGARFRLDHVYEDERGFPHAEVTYAGQ